MKASHCIQDVCREFRELFLSDTDMACALRLDIGHAQGILKGDVFPALNEMLNIQASLRRVAIAKERQRDC